MDKTSHHLLLISGPVGIGKSSAALLTAQRLRAAGVPTAVLDLDEIYKMLRQRDGFSEPQVWQHARRAAAQLAAYAWQQLARVVIVEGSFHTQEELDELRSGAGDATCHLVSLCAPYEIVHQRVMHDPDPRRVASKVPAFLQQLYAEFEAALPLLREQGWCLDVGALTAEQVAQRLADEILS